ncbi:MAG: hypothetical protein IH598_16070 [Bacteroidales bacterium]|nr:hypothetical protein [Bacteroidales bacterium]
MNLKSIHIWSVFLITIIFAACNTPKAVVDHAQIADLAYSSGDYARALSTYEELINSWNDQHPQKDNPYYDKAGHAAFMMKNYDRSIFHFAQSMHHGTASVETYSRLISYYREIKNFSKEMTTIEALMEAYPNSDEAKAEHSRLFEMLVETDRWEEAAEEWTKITRERDIHQMELYFEVNRKLENTAMCDSLSGVLLTNDNNNMIGLEWEAVKYYNRAEDRYNKEMEAYEQNKTNRQYLKLLEALEVVNADFQHARDNFEKLYNAYHGKRYANYLYNIYTRFQDEKKAAYYRERMK